MFSRANAAHPVGCDSSLQLVMAVWRALLLNLNFLGRVWQPAADNNGSVAHFKFSKKCTKRPLLFEVGCHTEPDHSAEWFAEARGS